MSRGEDLAAENAALRARVAALEAELAQLAELADRDTLTPLPNRRVFLRALERAIARVARHGVPTALLFADLDRLKEINDRHGHGAGDAALLKVAMLLRQNVRGTDLVARIGGDEFALLLDYVGEDAARAKAAALAADIARAEGRLPVSISIGVAALRPGDSAETAMARADADMYRQKGRRVTDR